MLLDWALRLNDEPANYYVTVLDHFRRERGIRNRRFHLFGYVTGQIVGIDLCRETSGNLATD